MNYLKVLFTEAFIFRQNDVIKEQVTCFIHLLGIKPSASGLGVQYHQYSHSTVLPGDMTASCDLHFRSLLC